MLGADHLIKHISSNPLISRPLTPASVQAADGGGGGGETAQRPHALEIYMASLRATQAMAGVDIVLAGHGDPVTDHVALIDERFRLHARRAEKIRRLIEEGGPATAYEIAQSLWGNVAVTQAYLTLSEVLGHVDLLVTAGRAAEQRDGGVVRFAAAG